MTRTLAKGCGTRPCDKGGATVQIVVRFDTETFSEIRAMAVKDGTSFAEAVRQLVTWGLMDRGAA